MSLVEVRGLHRTFDVRGRTLRAVDGVDLDIRAGETVGLVGESGSGKTTLGKTIVRLLDPTSGTITFDGTDITTIRGAELRTYRRRVQYIFQDPFGSLNPRATVGGTLKEALRVCRVVEPHRVDQRAAELLDRVGLGRTIAKRLPHELSGGQRQRVGIARALSVEPDFIVADEPVSALDVSVRAQILELLAGLRRDLGLTMLFVSHDLSVVRHFCDRVDVMYLGTIVERIPAAQLDRVQHPYSRALLDAVPAIDPRDRRTRTPLTGEVPSATNVPTGCAFRTRCPIAEPSCQTERPPLRTPNDPTHAIACPVVTRTKTR